eukprot:TRINITY_DN77101_c0_g1_i1.p1 TRINITY_DN77101_c0_g1~~TRINITY_DN77101_c0_g1_i1.p1  ORF type:complete len:647 (-),score=156.53 TRINITY_DN77101_c0_g1_i1:155-2095(-)
MADDYCQQVIGLFKVFDRNGDGVIDRQELGRVLDALDPISWDDERLDQMLREADTNLDGKIQYDEFTRWLFTPSADRTTFCRSVKDLAKDLIYVVRAAAALRELDAAPEAQKKKVLDLILTQLTNITEDPTDPELRTIHCESEIGKTLFSVRGCSSFLVAAGFRDYKEELVLPYSANVDWAVRELKKLKENGWCLPAEPDLPAELPPCSAIPAEEVGLPPEYRLFPIGTSPTGDIGDLISLLVDLPEMQKKAMGGKCIPQTMAMEDFMKNEVGMRQLPGEYFVQGVKAFELAEPITSLPPDKELVYRGTGRDGNPALFKVSVAEVLEWQSTFRTYYASDVYPGQEGKDLLALSLQGLSEAGEEAWKMKFAIRCSKNPVLMRFDGRVNERNIGDPASGRIYLISVCGIDFASRVHDHFDLTSYIKNWQDVYVFDENGAPYVQHGRDFELSGVDAKLNVSKTLFDLKKMCRLRLRAQDALGIQVVVEVGLGLGVFAGDALGIGGTVRMLAALATKRVLEEETFKHIRLVVLSLPIFRKGDNFEYYDQVFGRDGSAYNGKTPVLLMDQDMHAIALAAAGAGFTVGELNPADSHGVFGEYWQNFGPGTEEKLALTTCGLLVQHHAVNPAVLETANYIAVDASEPPATLLS